MRGLSLTAGWLAGALALLAACSYSPNIKSGELLCSDNRECPRGFACSGSNVCCANGDLICNAGGTGTGGVSGTGGSGAGTGGQKAAFIGTWTFGSTASVLSECEDNTTGTNTLANTTLAITAGATGGTALEANWSVWQASGCPSTISLSYDATGAHVVDTNWSCQDDSGAISDYWLVNDFDVTLTSATTATHYGLYYLEETQSGVTTICQQTVTATMTKTKN